MCESGLLLGELNIIFQIERQRLIIPVVFVVHFVEAHIGFGLGFFGEESYIMLQAFLYKQLPLLLLFNRWETDQMYRIVASRCFIVN
jgi:hypothetical protein